MDDLRYIIYVGDSFCSDIDQEHWIKNGKLRFQRGRDSLIYQNHPSIVAKHFGAEMLNFSFGGRSWWYSRCKLYQALTDQPDLLEKTFAIVFIHTDTSRINTGNDGVASNMWKENTNKPTDEARHANRLYIRYFYDSEFHQWAGEQWAREIARDFNHIPTIHFHGFPSTLSYNSLLPGMKFSTVLGKIQMSEMLGTEREIEQQLESPDQRSNHLNDHNNLALADITIRSLENYAPGTLEIDLTNFDLPNPNGLNWPDSGYGSR